MPQTSLRAYCSHIAFYDYSTQEHLARNEVQVYVSSGWRTVMMMTMMVMVLVMVMVMVMMTIMVMVLVMVMVIMVLVVKGAC